VGSPTVFPKKSRFCTTKSPPWRILLQSCPCMVWSKAKRSSATWLLARLLDKLNRRETFLNFKRSLLLESFLPNDYSSLLLLDQVVLKSYAMKTHNRLCIFLLLTQTVNSKENEIHLKGYLSLFIF